MPIMDDRTDARLSAAGAVVLGIVAVAALWWYVVDVVIGGSGEADRSMVFWGLPVLFLGVACGIVAAALAYRARSLMRSDR